MSLRVTRLLSCHKFNPLNAEFNSICHMLALLAAHHILHVSRIRVNGRSPLTAKIGSAYLSSFCTPVLQPVELSILDFRFFFIHIIFIITFYVIYVFASHFFSFCLLLTFSVLSFTFISFVILPS